ncbi:MAG: hypothetical protein Q4D91_07920 [Lautropia sp.]|nr:hypothetical protein [Lautropia sp.]
MSKRQRLRSTLPVAAHYPDENNLNQERTSHDMPWLIGHVQNASPQPADWRAPKNQPRLQAR